MDHATAESEEMDAAAARTAQGRAMSGRRRIAFVAPRHADSPNWPWISQIGPMRRYEFERIYIDNTFDRFPKLTRGYVALQYLRARRAIAKTDLAFFFSTDISIGMTGRLGRLMTHPKRVYVGFTQDGEWSQRKVHRLSVAMRQLDAVTVFSHDEHRLYIDRYGLNPDRMHVIPIHTDEPDGYGHYSDPTPLARPYVLSMGSPNRRFLPIAQSCRALKIPLVIITRPTHVNDSLDELSELGARIITTAARREAFTYLKHARLCAMVFQTPSLPGAFTTLIHAMNLRTPCVVSACLGMEDYVENERTGFIVPHGDQQMLMRRIEQLWSDPLLHERFVQDGFTQAQERFSLEAAASQFSALAERLLNSDAQT